MKLVLAPMEGLADAPMRALLTSVGGFDWCVSEFIRVNGTLLPARVFRRAVPESANGFRTPSGTPVHVQLLGSDPSCVAENAAVAAALGAPAIDLNFGCPAKTVNRHRGGAVLLDEPELVHSIVAAVRRAVPAAVPVSAKMRLGHRDGTRFLDNARGLAEAGAAWITVHARTKVDGYRPPAHWAEIARLAEVAGATPVIANGEVWTVADHARCVAESGCADVMLGRGAVASPGLARSIREAGARAGAGMVADYASEGLAWAEACELQRLFLREPAGSDLAIAGRHKQWLAFLARRYPQAVALFETVRPLRTRQEIDEAIVVSARRSVADALPVPRGGISLPALRAAGG